MIKELIIITGGIILLFIFYLLYCIYVTIRYGHQITDIERELR